jgi:hypothetical protein
MQIGTHNSNHNLSLWVQLLPLTCSMTLLINALTDGVKISLVLWKHHKTIPPLLNMVNKSNILRPPFVVLNSCWSDNYFRKHVNIQSHDRFVIRGCVIRLETKLYEVFLLSRRNHGLARQSIWTQKTWSATRDCQLCLRFVHGSEVSVMPVPYPLANAIPCVHCC